MYEFQLSISPNSRIDDADLERGLRGATRFELKQERQKNHDVRRFLAMIANTQRFQVFHHL